MPSTYLRRIQSHTIDGCPILVLARGFFRRIFNSGMNPYRNKTCTNCQFAEPFCSENYYGLNNGTIVMCRRYPPAVIVENGKLATKWPLIPSAS